MSLESVSSFTLDDHFQTHCCDPELVFSQGNVNDFFICLEDRRSSRNLGFFSFIIWNVAPCRFLFCRGQLSFVAVVKVSRDFLAQINTGRGCKLGPLWLDINQAYVNVSCGYMKTQTSSFSRVNLLPVLILKLHGRRCPASFPTAKKVLFSYFLCILNIFWAHLQQCLLKTKMLLLKLHPAALLQLYFRLTTKLCWLKNTENNFVYISKGKRLSQHCWCAGFHLISESLKEHLIFWEIHRPVPNVHMRLQQLVCLIDHKKSASGETVPHLPLYCWYFLP